MTMLIYDLDQTISVNVDNYWTAFLDAMSAFVYVFYFDFVLAIFFTSQVDLLQKQWFTNSSLFRASYTYPGTIM